jgi:4'-phosphopantetheinyl transferase
VGLGSAVEVVPVSLTVEEPDLANRLQAMSSAEREMMECRATPQLRRRYAASHLALREILASRLGVTADAIRIEQGETGKPFLPGNELHFNLTHSGEVALVALCEQAPLGIDLERVHELGDLDALLRRVCTERERERLAAMPEPSRIAAFLRLWVRKEALVKATGEGIGGSLQRLEVLGDELSAAGESWRIVDLEVPAPGHLAAVAIAAAIDPADVALCPWWRFCDAPGHR